MRVVVGVCVLAWVGVAVAGPVDKPPFVATPAELLAEAKAVPAPDASAVVLREDHTWTFDEHGRAETRTRNVISIRTTAGVDDWGVLETSWHPFYQERPALRVRVIGPGGDVAELDPKLVADEPAVSHSAAEFSDRRVLKAPLPRLVVGAVIEEEIVVRDRVPVLDAGNHVSFAVGRNGVPVQHTIVTVSAPSSLAVKLEARGFAKAPAPRTDRRAGRSTWTYDLATLPPQRVLVVGAPREVVQWPVIAVSTAPSWAAIAAEYKRIVDGKLAEPFDLPAGAIGSNPRDTLDHIVAWLHAHVRYTGIELADAAIVPRAPADTLKRGFGDCKDKATLLVAMLRKAGLRAEVVLVDTGPSVGIDLELPGMVFDHAIVRATVAGKDVWIDATEDLLPAGQLPARDQDRSALAIATDTRGLSTTPASSSADNVVHQTRSFEVPEYGRTKVTETDRLGGVFADQLRSWVRDATREAITKWATDIATDTYRAKLVRFTSTNPDDVSTPFVFTIENEGSQRVEALATRIDAYLFRSATIGELPNQLTSSSQAVEREIAARTMDYAWYRPHVSEVESRIVVPSGFTMPAMVADERRELGTMTLTTTRRIDGSEIVVTYRLDTGKRRITAKELAETRKAVRRLVDEPAEHIVIEHTTAKLTDDGKITDAITEANRLIALHPRMGVHLVQLAWIYERIGLFEAARRTVRKATTIEPASLASWLALADLLRRDTIGHVLGFDADRAGAIAAYRKALAIAPDNTTVADGLAKLLVRDAHSMPTSDSRERDEAIALWRRIGAADPQLQLGEFDIALALIDGGRFTEAEVAARAVRDGERREMLLVAVEAAQHGGGAAFALARTFGTGDKVQRLVTVAAGTLLLARRYEPTVDLMGRMTPAPDPDALAAFVHFKPVAFTKLDPADPTTPVKKLLAQTVGIDIGSPPWDPEIAGALPGSTMMKKWLGKVVNGVDSLPTVVLADLLAAGASVVHVDGSPSDGWRLQYGSQATAIAYAVLDRGKAKFIGMPELETGVGAYALQLVQRGDVAAATRWLDRLTDDIAMTRADNLVVKAYRDEKARVATLPRDTVELFAAISSPLYHTRVTPVLRRCATTIEAIKKLCTNALMVASGSAKDWAETAAIARAALASDPDDRAATILLGMASQRLHRFDGVVAALDAARAKAPEPETFDHMRIAIELERDPANVSALIATMAARPGVRPQELNNLAWFELFVATDTKKARELAMRAKGTAGTVEPALANTLAAIEAESNDPAAAWKYLVQSIRGKPSGADLYVLGRIAESVGLRDDAIALYRRVGGQDALGIGSHAFAQRNLRRLGVR